MPIVRSVILFLGLLFLISFGEAQEALNSTARQQNISLAETDASDPKVIESGEESQDTEDQRWSFHIQGTEIAQGQPGFHSPYAGIAHVSGPAARSTLIPNITKALGWAILMESPLSQIQRRTK
jgi:hypothetical protein